VSAEAMRRRIAIFLSGLLPDFFLKPNMKIIFTFSMAMLITAIAFPQDKNVQAIRKVLTTQTEAWNKGDIDEFMKGYWKNDSLKFIGKSGVTYGYQQTLERYKRNYGDTVKMGKLSFDILEVKKLSVDYYFVLGRFFLKRSIGDLDGTFTLLFRKINGNWVIVVDHTS